MKQVVVKAALMAGSMALGMLNKIEGPRLDNLEVTTADFGTPLNYFWGKRRLEGVPIIWAEKLREKKNTSKGKGGKYAEYKYFGTFAVAIADHEIDAVSRIWMDKHLVYDVTRAGPISPVIGAFTGLSGAPVKITNGRNMRIYLGTETQEPDPRMEAWCEDRYGADSCPAYRGVAYIVFQELPLEKFGNRIPQITVEAVNNSAPAYLFDTITPGAALGPFFSWDGARALFHNSAGSVFTIWDTPTLTKIIEGEFPAHCDEADIASNGKILGLGGTLGDTFRIISPDGMTLEANVAVGGNGDRLTAIGNVGYMRPYAGVGTFAIACSVSACTTIDLDFTPEMFFEDLSGNAWAVGMVGTNIYLNNLDTGSQFIVASPGGVTGSTSGMVNADDDFFVVVETTAIVIDSGTGTVLDSASIGGSAADHFNTMRQMPRGMASFFTLTQEVNASTLETVQTYDLTDWTGSNTTNRYYEPISHALWSGGGGGMTVRYLDRISSSGTDLADVIQDVSDRCGVVELDVSGLTQTVPGYSTVQGAAKDWIAPLLDIHDVDARPHNFAVQFLTRGSSAAGTISVSEFVREGDEPRYSLTIKQDTDLPRRVGLSFADLDKDQQKNTVLSQRPLDGTDGDRELTIDLSTYVATPGDAQKFADRFFRRKWNGREGVTNALTAQYLALEPGDVWRLQLDDVTQSHRLVKATISQGRINTEWERDFPNLHTLGTGSGAEMEGRDDDVIYVPAQTKGFAIDAPLVQDSHASDLPQIYYGAGSYGGDWPGATAYQVDGDGDAIAWNAVDSADNATWGYALEELGDANPNLWDRGNSVSVQVFGTLTNTTEAAIDANPLVNMAWLGNEYINFTTATLTGTQGEANLYTLSGFKRGRRGTEWACADHAVGDEFILVADLEHDGLGLSDVATDQTFKVQTIGRDPASAPEIAIEPFAGNSLKPYAPARVIATFDGTDWIFNVYRRARIGGAWTGGALIPNVDGATYEIEVYDGVTLKRTLELSGTSLVTYTNAMQVADFGSTQTTKPVLVAYQLNDLVGRGFALAA
jgi:hypothetical protein